jgi:hypothetical protein
LFRAEREEAEGRETIPQSTPMAEILTPQGVTAMTTLG